MILTVGMSPCIDVTARLDKFRLGKTNVAGEKTVTRRIHLTKKGAKSFRIEL